MFPLALKFQKLKFQIREQTNKRRNPTLPADGELSCCNGIQPPPPVCERLRVRRDNSFLAACRQSAVTKSSFWRSRFTDVAKKSAMKPPPRLPSTTSITKEDFVISSQRVLFFFFPFRDLNPRLNENQSRASSARHKPSSDRRTHSASSQRAAAAAAAATAAADTK